MTTIYLMRHGRVDNPGNVFYGTEFELSELGREQVRNTAETMKQAGVRPQAVLASPFTRTRQTAEILVGILDGTFTIDERLREWDAGPWFNKPLAEFHAATGYRDVPLRIDDPRVEPLEAMAKRVRAVLEELCRRIAGGTALVVSHREPMVSAILSLQGLPWGTIHDVSFHPADVWRLTFGEDGNFLKAEKAHDITNPG